MTLRYKHFLFPITAATVASWEEPTETWTWQGQPIRPPQELRVDGDALPSLPAGMTRNVQSVHANPRNIATTLLEKIEPEIAREPGSVTIRRSATGGILFEGVGLPGQHIDIDAAVHIISDAIDANVGDVMLPVIVTPPTVTVLDTTLASQGIKEFVTLGESDMSNSPNNRRHNIATGLSKFNGHLIPQGTVFSFDETLGPVDGSTGYLKELVIKGDKTIPDYGGGLCQVSTTAYRGVWEYGFPIVQRINHSYSVSHYFPQGTDATVYPPNVDMKFRNDSPGALLMQTYQENDLAYFIYYGTRDTRTAIVMGPYISDRKSPPPPKTEYTTDDPELAPGEKRKVGEATPGLRAVWYRFVSRGTGSTMDTTMSLYQARPLFYQIGGVNPNAGSGASPDWMGVEPVLD